MHVRFNTAMKHIEDSRPSVNT